MSVSRRESPQRRSQRRDPSVRSAVEPFYAMDFMREATALAASGRDIVRMEVGQPGGPAPLASRLAATAALEAPPGYTVAPGLPSGRIRTCPRPYKTKSSSAAVTMRGTGVAAMLPTSPKTVGTTVRFRPLAITPSTSTPFPRRWRSIISQRICGGRVALAFSLRITSPLAGSATGAPSMDGGSYWNTTLRTTG